METVLPLLQLVTIIVAVRAMSKTGTWGFGIPVLVFIGGLFSLVWWVLGVRSVDPTWLIIGTLVSGVFVVMWIRKVLAFYRSPVNEAA